MGFKDNIIGIVLVGLFALSILIFATGTAVNNGSDLFLGNQPSVSKLNSTLQTQLEGFEETVQSQREGFENSPPQSSGDEGFGLTSIVSNIKSFTSLAFGTFNIIMGAFSDILGIPKVVLNIILGALVITLLLLGWSVIKAGRT